MTSRAILEAELAKFVGQVPWGVTGSPPTGSDFSLKLGERLQRPPTNSGTQRNSWYGSFTLFVACAWRLEQDSVPILASGDDVLFDRETRANKHEPFAIVASLDPFIGRKVQNGELGYGFDLKLSFEDGLALFVFCDRSAASGEERSMSYELRTPDRRLFVRYNENLAVHTEQEAGTVAAEEN